MRIFITGADGLLGSNLVRLLLIRGHDITALIHTRKYSDTLAGLNIRRVYGDILEPSSFLHHLPGHDAVIHAAASTSLWPVRSETVRRTNVEGTVNVIEAVLSAQVKKMIYIGSASSVNTSGPAGGRYRYPGAKFGLDYNDSKFDALTLVQEAVKSRGLPALAILPTFMIGPWDSKPGSGRMVLTVARGRGKFYTGGGRNFIDVRDVAGAIANSLETGETGKIYIAGNVNLTYREFFSKTARIAGKPEPRYRVPDWLIKLVGMGGTLYGTLTGRQPLISWPMARASCETQYVSGESAVKGLQMPLTDIETSIKDGYKWFLENGYLSK